MKVKAHLVVAKGYERAITASQWVDEVLDHCDEHNKENGGENWRHERLDRTVVTVEFEVPDSVFDPPDPPIVLQGTVSDVPKKEAKKV